MVARLRDLSMVWLLVLWLASIGCAMLMLYQWVMPGQDDDSTAMEAGDDSSADDDSAREEATP